MPGLLIALIKQMKVTAHFLCLVRPQLAGLSAAEARVSCFPCSVGSHPSHPVADPVVDTLPPRGVAQQVLQSSQEGQAAVLGLCWAQPCSQGGFGL